MLTFKKIIHILYTEEPDGCSTSCDIRQKIMVPKVFLLTKIKPEYSEILYNPTHFPGPLVCQIRQVPLYTVLKELGPSWR
jgi:hypothetical protein